MLSRTGKRLGKARVDAARRTRLTEPQVSQDGWPRFDHLAAIVEFSGEAIIGASLDGIVTSFNPAAEAMFGYHSEEIIGSHVRTLSPDSGTEQSRDNLAMVKAGLPSQNVETVRVRKDGTVFPVSLTLSPIRDENGAVIGMFAILRCTPMPWPGSPSRTSCGTPSPAISSW